MTTDNKHSSISLLLKSLDPDKNLFDDAVYEIALTPKGNKLPPVREYDADEFGSSANASDFGARTPRISSPRTPRSNLISLQEEEAIIRKRRTEFFVNTLLMEINFNNIVDMKKAFDSAGGGVSLSQFVQIMIKAVSHKKEQENSIMARLSDLFAEIDIDGDKEMTWDEFTSFIIKSGIEPFDPTKSMKKYQEIFPRHEVICNNLSKIRYFPQIDKVVICDNNKDKSVQVYKSEVIKYQTEYLLYKELKFHTGSVLNAEYIPNKKYLVTSSSDCILAFWDVDSWRKKAEGITPVPQTVLLWYAPHDSLFTGGLDGNIYTWTEYFSEKEKTLKWKIKQVYRGHTDMVTAIVSIPNTPIIVSSSTDSSIFTWDVATTVKQKDLKGHVKGVYSLAYSHEHRFLISAGSDRDALVWNPLVKSRPIFRLKGHTSSLIHVEVIEGTPQIITADSAGVLKLWDIRNFECVQTFDSTGQIGELISFTCSVNISKPSGPHNQLLVGGNNKIVMFEYDKPGTPWLTMQAPIIAALYNQYSSTILTAGGDTIKIWDAKTGRLLRVYSGLCDSTHNVSLSSVCLDSSQKKIFTGDTDGNLQVYNYSNGAILRKLDSHRSLISQLIFCPQSKCVLSASWDGMLNVHDELDFNKKGRSVLRSTSSHKKDITVAAFAEPLSLMASGTSDGFIWLWDFEKCGFEGKLEPNTEEITALVFLIPYPVLCSADNHGNLTFWTVKPSLNKNHLLLRVPHTKDVTPNAKPTIVSALTWDKDQKYLYCGDELGQITIWNIRSLVNRDGISAGRSHKANVRGSSIITGSMSQSTFTSPAADEYLYKPIKPASRSDIVLVNQWSAHYSAITCLELIDVPSAILSASKDRRVRTWDRSGKYFGTLRQAEGNTRTWNFPLDDGIRKDAESKKVEEIQSLLEKKETRKMRRFKTVAIYDKPSTSSPLPTTPTTATIMTSPISPHTHPLDLLQLIDTTIIPSSKEETVSDNVSTLDGTLLSTPSSTSSSKILKRESSSTIKTTKKSWANPWYQITQSRIKTGDPELDKFNPNQPGQFPNLIQGLPLPDVRPLPHPLVFPTTRGKSPIQFDEDKPSTYFDLLKLTQADKLLNSSQLSAAKKLSMVLEQLDNEDIR